MNLNIYLKNLVMWLTGREVNGKIKKNFTTQNYLTKTDTINNKEKYLFLLRLYLMWMKNLYWLVHQDTGT